MTPHKTRRNKIFISYSHKDAVWLERLRVHLRPLERDFKADIWDDTKIQSGAMWKEEIERALDEAAVAILLVSPDFLASDFIASNELPSLLKAAEEEGTVILPLILNHSSFTKHEGLRGFQAFNAPSKPLISMPKDKVAAVLEKVAERITELLNASANMKSKSAPRSRVRRVRRPAGDRKASRANRTASRDYKGRAEINSSQQEDELTNSQSPAKKGHSTGSLLVIAVISLLALAVAIKIILYKAGDSPRGINSSSKSGPARYDKTEHQSTYFLLMLEKGKAARYDKTEHQSGQAEPQPNRVIVTIENGSVVTLFNDRLKIQLDEISLEEISNQYRVSFSLSSPLSEEFNIREMKVSDDEEVTYNAGGKLKIRLLAAQEQLADFSIEKMEN